MSFSAGTVGTRGDIKAVNFDTALYPVSIMIKFVTDSSVAKFMTFQNGNNLVLAAYRAVSTAVSSDLVTVRVLFEDEISAI